MRKLLLLATLTGSLLFGNDISIDTIGLNLGKAYLDYDKKDTQGSITLGNTPDKSFNSFELYTTLKPVTKICEEYNMKPYLSYTYSSNTDLKHQYILLGVNKYYTPKGTKALVYAGGLLGYGELKWNYDPLNTSKSINVDANSFMAGIQGGISYPVSSKISLSLNGKYLVHDYKTGLDPSAGASSEISHKGTAVVSFGIGYSF